VRTAELRAAVDEAVAERLTKRGYSRVSEGVYLLAIAPGVLGWVGIGLASRKRGGEVDADPMVGVRHDEVEALLSAGSGQADPTILRPLYELLPGGNYKTWSFNEDNLDQQAEALVESVVQHGQRLVHELKTLDALKDALEKWAFADTRRTRLPVVLLLQGDRDAAAGAVAREKRALADRGDEAIEAEYEEFATRVMQSFAEIAIFGD
jgi:hypothetical protein